MADTKLHFRTHGANLCGNNSMSYVTYIDEVTCKNCLSKIPAWKAERDRILAYEENHVAVVTFSIQLLHWNRFVAYIRRYLAINEMLGGLAGEVITVIKCVVDGKVEIIEKK